MRLRREFYEKNPDKLPTDPVDRGEGGNTYIYSSDEIICLSLEYADKVTEKEKSADMETDEEGVPRRYLRCPAAVTIGLLKRLVRGKYGLDTNHALDMLYGDSFLCDEYSLVDLAYMFDWKRKGPMRLKYRIYQDVDMPPSPLVNENIEEKAQTKESTEDIRELPDGEKNGDTPPPESGDHSGKQDFSSGSNVKMEVDNEEQIKTENAEKLNISSAKETITNGSLEKLPINTCKTTSTLTSTTGSSVADQEPSSQSVSVPNGSNSANAVEAVDNTAKHDKPTTALKGLKLPPKVWSSAVHRIAAKRTANDLASRSDSDASPAKKASTSSQKTPRLFQVRSAVKEDKEAVASVTESPVQEVAVNLTKPLSSPKKSMNEKEKLKERHSPSPKTRTESPNRPYSAPSPSQPMKISADDATAKQKNPSHSVLPFVPSNDDAAQQFRLPHPAWLNLARGARPGQMLLGGFPNRAALPPAHFLTSLIASQSPFPYLGMSLPNDGKKSAATQPKLMGPRALTGFPTPFNAMQGFPHGLSALLPLPREMLGSFYHSAYSQPRSFTPPPGRSSGSVASPKSSPSASGSPSSATQSSPTTKSTKSGQRPLAARRVTAPPPLVPIGSTPCPPIRSPPTLLPIKEASDKEQTSSDASSSAPATVVESSIGGNETEAPEAPKDEAKEPEKADKMAPLESGSTNQADSIEKSETSRAESPPASSETPPEASADS